MWAGVKGRKKNAVSKLPVKAANMFRAAVQSLHSELADRALQLLLQDRMPVAPHIRHSLILSSDRRNRAGDEQGVRSAARKTVLKVRISGSARAVSGHKHRPKPENPTV